MVLLLLPFYQKRLTLSFFFLRNQYHGEKELQEKAVIVEASMHDMKAILNAALAAIVTMSIRILCLFAELCKIKSENICNVTRGAIKRQGI